MVKLPAPEKELVVNFTETLINEQHLVRLETDPHVTIRWGIKTDDVELVKKVLGKLIPVRLMFGATKPFLSTKTRKTDIIMIDVYSMFCKRLRHLIDASGIDCENVTPFYPHLTLAETLANTWYGYVGENPLIGKKIVVNELVFRKSDGTEELIQCQV